ncbi:hypothetical protein HDU93_007822 [Gonapodya sp. JEL0774]|nr:hypothetical protein HDU93_007822 [Gonapodya sp. JEL0774]
MPPRNRRQRVASLPRSDPCPPSPITAPSPSFPFTSLPPEIQQYVGRYWYSVPFGLPTDALNRQLRQTLGNPMDVAARAVARFGSPRKALLRECDRDGSIAVTHVLTNRCDASAGHLFHALIRSCRRGDVERVRLFLAAGAGKHRWDPEIPTYLPLSFGLGYMTIFMHDGVRVRLEAEEGIHSEDYPVRVACEYGHFEVVKVLMESGLQLSANQQAIMRAACSHGHLDLVRYLVQHKCGFLEKSLWEASSGGHAALVEFLLSQGADFDQEIHEAVLIATLNEHVDVVRLLFDNGGYTDKCRQATRELLRDGHQPSDAMMDTLAEYRMIRRSKRLGRRS